MDHRKRLKHARHHLKTFERAVKTFVQREPYIATSKYDRERRCYVGLIRKVLEMPDRWPLVVGDIVHNLRSALDSLAYALAVKGAGRRPDKDEVRKIQFPICTLPEAFHGKKGQLRRRLTLLAPTAQAAVERLQPYNAAMKSKNIHVLAALDELANIDKHRHILLVVAAAESSRLDLSGRGIPKGASITGFSGELKKRTEIGSWSFASPSSSARSIHPEVQVKASMTFQVRFGKGTAIIGEPVAPVLLGMHDYIRDTVFPPLEALLL